MSWTTFHFLYPLWFLALLPAVFFIWRFKQIKARPNFWADKIDGHLLPHLLVTSGGPSSYLPVYLLALIWFLAICALANPVWQKKPQADFQGASTLVVALDLSRSMDAQDLKPSRLGAAKQALLKQLQNKKDLRVALIVFAEQSFVAAPLSQDASTVLDFIQHADTRIMPTQGSRPDRALMQSLALLQKGQQKQAQVLLITDGAYDKNALREAASKITEQNYLLTIVGVGSQEGGAIQLPKKTEHGLFPTGTTVKVNFDAHLFSSVAQQSDAFYFHMSKAYTGNIAWIKPLKGKIENSAKDKERKSAHWVEKGPYLLCLLVPLAALGFRRGWLGMWCLTCALAAAFLTPAADLHAEEASSTQKLRAQWHDVWVNTDYQAYTLFKQGELKKAAEKFSDPSWQAAAWYRLGVFDKAAAAYARVDTAEAHFNRGNALVQQGKLEEALAAYNSALQKNIEFRDASFNRQLVEQYLHASHKKDESASSKQHSPQNTEEENGGTTQKTKQAANKAKAVKNQELDKEAAPSQTKKQQAASKESDGEQGKALAQASTHKVHSNDAAGSLLKSNLYDFKEKSSIGPAQWLNMIEDKPNELLRLKFAFIRANQEPKSEDGPEPW